MWMAETKRGIIMKKIHIFGANGFIGSNLLKKFNEERKYPTIGYSSKNCNLLSLNAIEKTLTKLTKEDTIIMTSSITRLKENSLESMIKNITMADNISKFIRKIDLDQFIFLSTGDIYGINPVQPINEKLLPEPNDYYSISKLVSEFILKKSCSEKEIPILILRLSAVYGPGDKNKSTINKLVESAISNRKIIIYGDGTNKRDFVYVDDVYQIIKKGVENKTNAILNLATGKSHSIKEITNIIKQYCPVDFSIKYKQKEQERIKEMNYDVSLLKEIFPDFNPKNIKKGLALYISQKI